MSGEVRLTEGDVLSIHEVFEQYPSIGPGPLALDLTDRVLAAVEAILAARLTLVEGVIEWVAAKEADWAASRRAHPGDSYAEGARDVCDVVETRLRAALAPQPAPGEIGGAS